MGSEWNTSLLESLNIKFEDGDRSSRYPKANQFLGKGNHPFLNTKNIIGNHFDWSDINFLSDDKFSEIKKGRAIPGDVIMSTRGSKLGKVAYFESSPWGQPLINAQLLILRCNDERLHPKYLWHVLESVEGQRQIDSLKSGSAQPQLPVRDLKKFEVSYPGYDTQLKIISLGESLNKKIQLNRQINQTLEQMAQALFKSWFVDFDPVIDNALAAGNPIPEELQARAQRRQQQLAKPDHQPLPDDVRQLFPSEFEETEALGWVPKGWECGSLIESINLIGGGTPKTTVDEYWGGAIPWFSVVDAPNDSDIYVLDTEKYVTQLGVDNSSTKVLRAGTTIISARGTVGKCALVAQPTAMNQSCYGVQGKEGFPDEYIYFLIRYRVSDLQLRGHGSVFNTITRDTFESIKSPQPSVGVMGQFAKLVKPLFEKVYANGKQTTELAKLRDTLLPKLISGELRLPESMLDSEANPLMDEVS